MRHEWTELVGLSNFIWAVDPTAGVTLDGEPVDPEACDAWPDEILRLVERVRELEEGIRRCVEIEDGYRKLALAEADSIDAETPISTGHRIEKMAASRALRHFAEKIGEE